MGESNYDVPKFVSQFYSEACKMISDDYEIWVSFSLIWKFKEDVIHKDLIIDYFKKRLLLGKAD